MLFVDLDPTSFLFKSNEFSPAERAYTGLVSTFLRQSADSLGCFFAHLRLVFISFIVCLFFFILEVILMDISEWKERTNSLISLTRSSLYTNSDTEAFHLSTEINNGTGS